MTHPDQSTLSVLVIGKRPTDGSIGSQTIEIDARLPGLASLFGARCHMGQLPVYGIESHAAFKSALLDFLDDGGQVHYVLDPTRHPTDHHHPSMVIAAATVQLSYSPLRSHFVIEDFLVDEALSAEDRHTAADLLLRSIRSQAVAEAERRARRLMLSFIGNLHGPVFERHDFTALHHGAVTMWGLPVHPTTALRAAA